MSKDIFSFKKFSIHQKDASLKVCTDSCLFGAWVASHKEDHESVIDIGSGTGLLSLMYAQMHPLSKIHALEIDEISAKLTEQNFRNSSWENNLKVFHDSLQLFSTSSNMKYDCLISNPPFFTNQLNSENHLHNLAKHSSNLSRPEFLEGLKMLMKEDSVLYILLPPFEGNELIKLALEAKIYLNDIVKVQNFDESPVIRYMMRFGTNNQSIMERDLSIYAQPKIYSPAFIGLLKDYYLYI